MRIDSLWLQNFRGIREMALKFPAAQTSVIVGINGAGKSSILDCMAILLSRLIGRIRTSRGTGRFFTQQDIHNHARFTHNTIAVILGSELVEWRVTKTRQG